MKNTKEKTTYKVTEDNESFFIQIFKDIPHYKTFLKADGWNIKNVVEHYRREHEQGLLNAYMMATQ
jgi:hypothetical protein